jgi:hypothetical protein
MHFQTLEDLNKFRKSDTAILSSINIYAIILDATFPYELTDRNKYLCSCNIIDSSFPLGAKCKSEIKNEESEPTPSEENKGMGEKESQNIHKSTNFLKISLFSSKKTDLPFIRKVGTILRICGATVSFSIIGIKCFVGAQF